MPRLVQGHTPPHFDGLGSVHCHNAIIVRVSEKVRLDNPKEEEEAPRLVNPL